VCPASTPPGRSGGCACRTPLCVPGMAIWRWPVPGQIRLQGEEADARRLYLPRCGAGQPLSSKIGSSIQLSSRRNPVHQTMMATSNSVPCWSTGTTSRTPLTLASTRSASAARDCALTRSNGTLLRCRRNPGASFVEMDVSTRRGLRCRVRNAGRSQRLNSPGRSRSGGCGRRACADTTHPPDNVYLGFSPLPYGLGANVRNCRCRRASSVPPGSARRLPPRPRSCRRHGRVGVCSGTGSDSRCPRRRAI
jgi:hypothetical protein